MSDEARLMAGSHSIRTTHTYNAEENHRCNPCQTGTDRAYCACELFELPVWWGSMGGNCRAGLRER